MSVIQTEPQTTVACPTVAYLGACGAFSERAAKKYFGNLMQDVSVNSFNEITNSVQSGRAQYGILPLENSLAGTVADSYELITEQPDIQIVGEVILRIEHCLLALPGVKLSDIQYVRSHPQALAQCTDFLKIHEFRGVNWSSTVASAEAIVKEKLTNAAAIASQTVAGLYGLQVLAKNIQDLGANYTRFLVLGKEAGKPKSLNKTSVMFTIDHRPGALVSCLQCLSISGLNLTKIDSKPMRDKPWEYIFYVDFEGHISNKVVQDALSQLKQATTTLRILGSYAASEDNWYDRSQEMGYRNGLMQRSITPFGLRRKAKWIAARMIEAM